MPQPTKGLAAEIAELAAHINAATYRLLCLIREFDSEKQWADQGARSCAHWLNWRIGLSFRTGRERVRVAHALAELPKTSEAFESGKLSYSKVRAICRVGTPNNEEYLLGIALRGTAAHVDKLVRLYRKRGVLEDEQLAELQEQRRFVRTYVDDDTGMLMVQAALPPDEGAVVLKALEAASDRLRENQRAAQDGPAGPFDSRFALAQGERASVDRADAFVEMAGRSLGHNEVEVDERYQVVVHVNREITEAHTGEGASLCRQTARRLACDAQTVQLDHDAQGNVVNVGRKTRKIPKAMRRALQERDSGCRFPGCTNTRYVDAHHIEHWADGGETNMENLILLCRGHHRSLHEQGFGVGLEVFGFVFTQPDGSVLEDAPPMPELRMDPVEALAIHHEELRLGIHELTTMPGWEGEVMDYAWAVQGLEEAGL